MQTWGTGQGCNCPVFMRSKEKEMRTIREQQEKRLSRTSNQRKKLEPLIRDNIEIGSPDGHRRSLNDYLLSLCCQESAAPASFKRPTAIDRKHNLTEEAWSVDATTQTPVVSEARSKVS